MSQNLQNVARFQKFQLDNLVDFEKCCKTRIFLQKSVPIQPKTSNILPKICQKLATTLRVPAAAGRSHASTRTGTALAAQLAAPCGKIYRARSRLYRNEILQVNMRLKALAEIYVMHSFAPFFNLKISAKNRQHFFAIELLNFRFFFIFCVEFCIFLRIFMNFCPDFATNSRKE